MILITVDVLRPDHLSCYGYKRVRTENTDRLAREGVLLTKAFSTGPSTRYSVLSLMTSYLPAGYSLHRCLPAQATGLQDHGLHSRQPLISHHYGLLYFMQKYCQ